MKKLSLKIKILIGIIVLFIVYNIFWSVFTYIRWRPFCEPLEYIGDGGYSLFVGERGEEGRYIYGAFLPQYLSYAGNLSISRGEVRTEDIPKVSMLIFPKLDGYEIYVKIYKMVMDETGLNGKQELMGTVILDENMEYYYEPTEEEERFFEEYKDDIAEVYEEMNKMWEIN